MKTILRKTVNNDGETSYNETISKEDLLQFQQKFMSTVSPVAIDPEPLFGSDGKFKYTNYASGLDLLLREYFDSLYKSPRINGSYSIMIQDVIKAIFCVSKFKDDITAMVMLDYYNKCTGRYDSYIFDICWDIDGRHMSRFRVNSSIGSFNQYHILINFIADYGISQGMFGKVKNGYNFNLTNTTNRSYKGI